MIEGLKPYSAIKDSGVPWLGSVPAHWEVKRLKTVFDEVDSRSESGGERLLSLRMKVGLVDHHANGGKHIPAEALVGYKRTAPGDVVMNRMRASSGLFGKAVVTGLVSPDYAVLRSKTRIVPDYFVYLFQTSLMMSIFRTESRGLGTGEAGFLRLYTERFGMLSVATPPFEEQERICRFVKYVDRVVAGYIRAKQNAMKLLAEQREAVTSSALQSTETRNVRLAAVTDVIQRPIDRSSYKLYTPIGLFNRGRGVFHKPPTLGAELGDSDFYRIECGDLILSGQFAWEGAVTIAGAEDGGCVASHRYHVLRGKSNAVQSAYLLAFLRTSAGHELLNYHSRGGAGRNRPLNLRTLLKEKIPIPAIALQEKIVDLVNQESKFGRMSLKAVQLVGEYRNRIVSEIVTGMLDVREAAARLPEQTPQPQPLDEIENVQEDDETAEIGELEAEDAA